MRKRLLIILLCSCMCGCSVPTASRYSEVYSFTKEERRIKGKIGKSARALSIKDFRGNDSYEEDIEALDKRVEAYILSHPDMEEITKNKLRNLRVTSGLTQEEVRLLVGEPNKITKGRDKSGKESEVWIYRLNKINAFTFFIIPLFIVHESYYLYFQNTILTDIEKHSLRQTVYQSDGAGPANPSN